MCVESVTMQTTSVETTGVKCSHILENLSPTGIRSLRWGDFTVIIMTHFHPCIKTGQILNNTFLFLLTNTVIEKTVMEIDTCWFQSAGRNRLCLTNSEAFGGWLLSAAISSPRILMWFYFRFYRQGLIEIANAWQMCISRKGY